LRQVTNAPILHFATHAFADLENPDLSYILLAPGSQSQRYDYLFLKEVSDLPLKNFSLVTLSACETGTGKDVPGEGVQSFTRSFLTAGVPSVVTSLWAVPDRSTSELMLRFYSRLSRGESLAGALRGAKLDFIHSQSFGHPANWAAFVVNGDGSARVPYVVGFNWLVLPFALLIAVAYLFWRKPQKMGTKGIAVP
jgi:CHAT domain-containing protein